jgi:geranylgeranyl diphosphate synthase type I
MTTMLSTLDRTREAVLPAMRAAVGKLDLTSGAQAGYHLGWTDVDGNPADGHAGKAVRPALALLSAEAAGAPVEDGVPGAVAVELVHNFSLLHDDLMDGDLERRHRKTVWAVWGSASAILTGDALLALAQEVLLECESPHAIAAGRLLAAATRELIRGQVDDLAFERRTDVSLAECLDMAGAKTAALLSASASIGAVLAGAGDDLVAALAAYGRELGIAFQLVDDLLGIWGDPAVTGKPVFSDLRSRKKSLPVTYAVGHGGEAGKRLAGWLATPPLDGAGEGEEDELRAAADLVEAGGGRAWAAVEAARRLDLAADALRRAAMPAGPCEELLALGHFIVEREA